MSFQLQVVSGENGIELIDKGSGCFRLEISGADVEKHDGEIVCTAVNEHGQAESRARILVEPIEEESKSAPTFIKDIQDQVRQHSIDNRCCQQVPSCLVSLHQSQKHKSEGKAERWIKRHDRPVMYTWIGPIAAPPTTLLPTSFEA